jgi:hypothetical protein
MALNFNLYTEYTQNNGAVSLYSQLKPHHSFVYTLYNIAAVCLNLREEQCFKACDLPTDSSLL